MGEPRVPSDRVQKWANRRTAKRMNKTPRLWKLMSWADRRKENALDREPIGSERVAGDDDYLYGPHGWEPVRTVKVVIPGAGVQLRTVYRKVRDPNPVAVAKLHRSSGHES